MKRESYCGVKKRKSSKKKCKKEGEDIKRGAWTLEEDTSLIHVVTSLGHSTTWSFLAKASGLKRTGKSCRLRWLNYLKPGIKRGNLTPQEHLLIGDLHSELGNRWSKIASHLPGRTDNEIKNYWRARVQKQAKQLNMESDSQSFTDAIRCHYMPVLVQKTERSPDIAHTDHQTAKETCTLNIPHHQKTTTSSVVQEELYNVVSSTYDMDLESSMLGILDFHVPETEWLTAHDVADVDAWHLGI